MAPGHKSLLLQGPPQDTEYSVASACLELTFSVCPDSFFPCSFKSRAGVRGCPRLAWPQVSFLGALGEQGAICFLQSFHE